MGAGAGEEGQAGRRLGKGNGPGEGDARGGPGPGEGDEGGALGQGKGPKEEAQGGARGPVVGGEPVRAEHVQ